MKLYLPLLMMLMIGSAFSQSNYRSKKQPIYSTEVPKSKLPVFIDSLKTVIEGNFIRTKTPDTTQNAVLINKLHSSSLFIIDGKFFYTLDNVSAKEAVEFSKEFLILTSVEKIDVIKKPFTAIYGARGSNGVILIQMKKGVKYNPSIAGLKVTENMGSNYRIGVCRTYRKLE